MAAATQEKKPKTQPQGLGVGPLLSQSAAAAQAQNQQPDSIPSMLKPGEFVLPPDTVHAMGGKAVLQHAVDQTHTPSNAGANVPLGFRPELFLANGGAPEDELKKANSFGDAAAAASSPGTTVPQAAAASSPSNTYPGNRTQGASGFSSAPVSAAAPAAPAAPAAAPAAAGSSVAAGFMPASRAVYNESGKEIANLASQGRYGAAAGEAVRGAAAYIPAVADDVVGGAVRAIAPGIIDAGKQVFGLNSAQAAQATPAPAPPPSATGVSAITNPTDARLAAGTQTTPGAAAPAAPTAATAPTAAPAPSGMVTRDGNSYSGANVAGDITINGVAPRNGGAISARNDQAAENLAAGFRPGMFAQNASAASQPGLGFGPGSVLERQQQEGFTGVIGQQGGNGNMWGRTPEQQRRDAEVQASSIHRPTAALGVNALRSFEAQDVENVRGANALQRASLEQAAANARAAGQNATELQRTGMREQGETTRAGFRARSDAERNQMERERLNMDQTARGFQTRAAQQMENLQKTYMDPNSTPEQRLQAQQAILALQGKSPEGRWKAVALQGGTDAQGNKTESVLGAVNEQTGEMRRYGGQAAGPIDKNQQALAIKNDTSMSLEQRADALRKLGYS